MNLRSLLQDILSEVSSRIISFQMELHLLITLVRSSDYFRFIESLRTCIMASQSTGTLKHKITYMHFGFEEFFKFFVSNVKVFISDVICMGLLQMGYA